MNFLKQFMKYLPAVLAGAVAVEGTVAGMPGESKKAVVLAAIQTAAKVGESIEAPDVQKISALTDSVVGALNSTGYFTSSTKPAP